MFAVTVQFQLHPGAGPAFLEAMREQARSSVREEPGCHQFDVCQADTGEIFLYEIYQDEAAFQLHLASAHYAAFSDRVATLVAEKRVSTWQVLEHVR